MTVVQKCSANYRNIYLNNLFLLCVWGWFGGRVERGEEREEVGWKENRRERGEGRERRGRRVERGERGAGGSRGQRGEGDDRGESEGREDEMETERKKLMRKARKSERGRGAAGEKEMRWVEE